MIYDEYLATDTKPTPFRDMFTPPKPYIIEGCLAAEHVTREPSRDLTAVRAGASAVTSGEHGTR